MSLHELVQKKLELEHQWASQALTQKEVTSEMRWIDLEVKDLRIKINDQCETDAKKELIVESNKIDT